MSTRTAHKMIRNRVTVESLAELNAYKDKPTKLTQTNGAVWIYVANSTATVDNVMVAAATGKGAGNWHRLVFDRRLVPQIFGAVGDGTTNDSAAWQAFLDYVGPYQHFVPAGVYRLSSGVTRTNKAGISLTGEGTARTILQFDSDTDGLSLVNDDYAAGQFYYGSIEIRNLQIQSTGVKSGSKNALYIHSNHLTRPGVVLENVAIRSMVASNMEWGTGVFLHDCSATSIDRLDIQLYSRSASSCLKIRQGSGLPCVEHNWSHLNFRLGKISVDIQSTFALGVEGVHITDATLLDCKQGVVATSTSGSPYLTLKGVHVNSIGGEALYMDGYQQSFIHESLFYVNKDTAANITPVRGVYIKDTIHLAGNFEIHTQDAGITKGVEFAGSTALVNLDIDVQLASGAADAVYVNSTTLGTSMLVNRLVSGSGSGGALIAGPGAASVGRKMLIRQSDLSSDSVIPMWSSVDGTYYAVNKKQANAASHTLISASSSIDPSVYDLVYLDNGSTNIIVTVDLTKAINNQDLVFIRYGNGTGTVTLTTTDPANNKIQNESGVRNGTWLLPVTAGQRQVIFTYIGGNLNLKAGGASSYSLPAATTGAIGGVKLLSNQYFPTASSADSSVTVNLALGKVVIADNTGTGTQTIVLDVATISAGEICYVKRYPNAGAGPIVITTSSPSGNKVEIASGTLQPLFSLPSATGQRQVRFYFDGTHFEFLGY